MKLRSCLLPLAALAGFAIAPPAKADFLYDIQSTWTDLHVQFELPTFEQNVVGQTTFNIATDSLGPVTHFGINGGSGTCDDSVTNAAEAPCWVTHGLPNWGAFAMSPSFAGPGTFTFLSSDFTTTVTIREVSAAVPEPASCILLSLALLGAGLAARRRRAV